MKFLLFCISAMVVIFQSCKEKNYHPKITLNDLEFNSIFAGHKKDTMHTYCLLGSGYFRAPASDNADSLIKDWLLLHPNAEVISVTTHGPTLTDYPDSKMTYCWLIDNKDTLNNYLIRNGCFPGGTMVRPKTREEMSDREKEFSTEEDTVIVYIDKIAEDKFLNQIQAAEEYAKQNRLGIWNKKEEDE